jgi:NAD(P)-dependent dehydrogenase (short-subunit alcohol dehydrogenase family)
VVEVTDGTWDFNATRYRDSLYYDLAKMAVNRLAYAQAQELREHDGAAVALTPGFLRSEVMLEHFGVTEANWREATAHPSFAVSETPAFVGRAVAALATDPGRMRWSGRSVDSGTLAKEYGFNDVDGSRPDVWRYLVEVVETGKQADPADYR